MFINIFGGITRCDLVAEGVLGALERVEAHGPAGGPARRHERRGGAPDPRRGRAPADRARGDDAGGRRASRRLRERRRRHEHPGRRRHAARGPGHHREGGHVPHAAEPRVRHAGGGGRHARQGGPGRRGHPGVRHGGRRRARGRREHVDDLRAAAVRGRGDPGVGRRGRRPRRVHHRGHPGQGHGARAQLPEGARHDADRPELPGRDHARRGQRRDHPARGVPAGPGRVREPLGHARVSDRARAHAARDRPVDLRRHGRRPGARDRVHRGARGCSRPTPRPT